MKLHAITSNTNHSITNQTAHMHPSPGTTRMQLPRQRGWHAQHLALYAHSRVDVWDHLCRVTSTLAFSECLSDREPKPGRCTASNLRRMRSIQRSHRGQHAGMRGLSSGRGRPVALRQIRTLELGAITHERQKQVVWVSPKRGTRVSLGLLRGRPMVFLGALRLSRGATPHESASKSCEVAPVADAASAGACTDSFRVHQGQGQCKAAC